MPWRVIDADGETWHVHPAAEMPADARLWRLTLSFRAASAEREPRVLWAPYPLQSSSKSSLFKAADRLSDDALRKVLVQRLS